MNRGGQYHDLDIFSDWVDAAIEQQALFPMATPGLETQQRVREALGFCSGEEKPLDVQIDGQWEKDGLSGEAISWSVGYGPRTEAWLLKPAGAKGPLPAVVALYEHGGFKYLGKEKIAIGPDEPLPFLQNWWDKYYGGRPFANALAQAGFAVLIPDTFLWGSRRFPQEVMPDWAEKALVGMADSHWLSLDIPYEMGLYNFSASLHENQIEKLCRVLGTTLAGMVSHEDRIAVNYLRSRDDIDIDHIGCVGLSGGGARAALLQATHPHIQATVVVSMMASYAKMLDRDVTRHTWMIYPSGWSKFGDWPDLAACRAPSPLLVQYNLQDELFALEAMQAAHERLTQHYQNMADAYKGEFYPGGHKFDLKMQDSAFKWLATQLASG